MPRKVRLNEKRPATASLFHCLFFVSLFRHSLQPLHHAEHNGHGDQADEQEHAPALPDVPSVEHDGTNEDEEVADGRGSEPQALAKAHHVARSHLRDEGQA